MRDWLIRNREKSNTGRADYQKQTVSLGRNPCPPWPRAEIKTLKLKTQSWLTGDREVTMVPLQQDLLEICPLEYIPMSIREIWGNFCLIEGNQLSRVLRKCPQGAVSPQQNLLNEVTKKTSGIWILLAPGHWGGCRSLRLSNALTL